MVTLECINQIPADQNLVLFLDADSRDEALDSLIESLSEQGRLQDEGRFRQAVLDREQIVSTGIGFGVAIPHAKLKNYSDFFVAIGIQKGRGIDWNSLDGLPVNLIFLIGGPEDRHTEYLKILSTLTAVIRNESKRRSLLEATSAEEVIKVLWI
ncbi:MAG: hypothetical protein RLZZ453_1074 [Chlamydiota bacterium]